MKFVLAGLHLRLEEHCAHFILAEMFILKPYSLSNMLFIYSTLSEGKTPYRYNFLSNLIHGVNVILKGNSGCVVLNNV